MSPALLEALIIAGIQYGPQLVTDIKNLLSKKDATIDDVEVLFSNLKPYSYFNIPDFVPGSNPIIVNPPL